MDGQTDTTAIRTALLTAASALRTEIAEGVQAPGQMTYGSQAAAATQVFEQQRDLALRDRAVARLAQVDAALARLDAGTYGRCTTCGTAIPTDRLAALPWAALCIACQSAPRRR